MRRRLATAGLVATLAIGSGAAEATSIGSRVWSLATIRAAAGQTGSTAMTVTAGPRSRVVVTTRVAGRPPARQMIAMGEVGTCRLVIPLQEKATGLLAPPADADCETGAAALVPIAPDAGAGTQVTVTASGGSPVSIEGPVDGDAALRDRMRGFVDARGQASKGHWPEKVSTEAELRDKHRASLEGVGEGLDEGSATGPGFFTVGRGNGRWWLRDTRGRRFFSLGVDVVTPASPTVTGGREGMFQDLPRRDDPLAAFYGRWEGRETFDPSRANLRAIHGPDWERAWRVDARRRLLAWGFNTIGNWSDEGLIAEARMPYVAEMEVSGAFDRVATYREPAIPDPYDRRFATAAEMAARDWGARHGGDHALVGTFADNELPWGRVGEPGTRVGPRVLALGSDHAARRELSRQVAARYRGPTRLARAWRVSRATARRILAGLPVTRVRWRAGAARDLLAFEADFADRYFAVLRRALRAADPHHLFLGTRFYEATPEVVRACARRCDAISANVYERTPTRAAWRGIDAPILIGEFHFGSPDRGLGWGGVTSVPREGDRGRAYRRYVEAAKADPRIVGAHWFQWADEPASGRARDGENGHVGLVAVTDLPYPGLVGAMTRANAGIRAWVSTSSTRTRAGRGGRAGAP